MTGVPGAAGSRGLRLRLASDLPRDFMPMKRFSTMSMRPTPCLPLWGEPATRGHRQGVRHQLGIQDSEDM